VASAGFIHAAEPSEGACRGSPARTAGRGTETPWCHQAVAFITLSELFCGVLLGFVFIQSHNGMEVYNDSRDFVSSQLASTRNVHSNLFNDW
jgi:hypothetical protein